MIMQREYKCIKPLWTDMDEELYRVGQVYKGEYIINGVLKLEYVIFKHAQWEHGVSMSSLRLYFEEVSTDLDFKVL
jgi:hypothetical protein